MRMKSFYTTGDVAQILTISRATVSRKFDAGILQGKKNPITGERLISHESLVSFMRRYGLENAPMAQSGVKRIVLGTQDENLYQQVVSCFERNEKFAFHVVNSGYDLLVQSSKNPPDLLLLDDDMASISSNEAIHSLKRLNEDNPFPIICFLQSNDPQRVMDVDADEFMYKDTIESSAITRKVMNILGMEHDEQPRVFDHQRRWPRIPVSAPVHLVVYRQDKPAQREIGTARIENISVDGAYLSRIRLDGGSFPSDTFRFRFTVDTPPLKNLQAECKVVRLKANGMLTAGVQFTNMSQQNRDRISQLVTLT